LKNSFFRDFRDVRKFYLTMSLLSRGYAQSDWQFSSA
jgi:hypothetical protein